MKPTQHQKIITMCKDGEFHCQSQFWNISKSPHKRRAEIEDMGKWKFASIPCTHGIKNSKDFKMILVKPDPVYEKYQENGEWRVRKVEYTPVQASISL